MTGTYQSVGDEFLVNTLTSGMQQGQVATWLTSGGFVLVWSGDDGVKAQRFASDGTPAGAEFLITAQGGQPAVSVLPTGGFVVAWRGPDPSSGGILAQRFNDDGTSAGAAILVNTVTSNLQVDPAVAGLPSGGYVVSWTDFSGVGGDASGSAVKAQIFDAAGTKVGGEFLVNAITGGDQKEPVIAGLDSGNFVIAWASSGEVKAQLFTPAGARIGAEFLVNTSTLGAQESPAITVLASGNFVVSWRDQGDDSSVKAQIFDASGTKVGGEILVNTVTSSTQWFPAITALPSGGFVVAWEDTSGLGGDASGDSVKAQVFDAAGAKVGDEFLVNTTAAGNQEFPAITALPSGEIVVAWKDWSGEGGDTDMSGIKARMFEPFVNQAPSGADATVTIDEDGAHIFSSAEFGFADADGNGLDAIIVTTLPVAGALTLDGVAVTAGQAIDVADVDAGLLVFTPDADANGTGYASFTFQVRDDGGTAEGGVDTDQSPNTITLDVTAVNDAPAVTITPPGGGFEAAGGETRVNTTTVNDQRDPSVAALEGGGYVVTWMSQSQDGSGWGIYAQRYDASGAAQGDEFLVNTTTANNQESPSVAALDGGGYVITWMSLNQDGSGYGVYTQRYDASGAAQGGETLVNTTTANNQFYPAIAALEGGGYIVTWMSLQDGSGYGIYAQRYDASGAAQGGETLVNTTTANNQESPSVAALDGGGYVVTWMSFGQDGSGYGVYTKRYDASGAPQGDETLVNTTTASQQWFPSVAGLDGGGHVVAWMSLNQDGSGWGIYAQRYDASGAAQGGETLVSTTTTDNQLYPSVAALDGGGYVVTWMSFQDGSGYGVYAQRYDASGAPQGGETLVNTTTANNQESPSVAALDGGGYVVTWMSHNQDGSGWGIYAQRFEALPGAFNATEQAPLDLKGTIAVGDIDAESGTLTVTLTVDYGVLDLGLGDSGATIVSGNGTGTVVVEGTLAQVQALLGSGGTSTVAFTPDTDDPPASAQFSVTVNDNGNAGGDPGLTSDASSEEASAQVTIAITAINDAPGGADKTITIDEDGSRTFAVADFGFADPAEGDAFAGVVLTTLPADGTLTLNGSTVAAGTFVTQADIASGLLVFTPEPDGNGTGYASLTFQVRDDGGTAGGGVDTDQSPNTITFDVTAVNDAPVVDNAIADQHSDEDEPVSFQIPLDTFSDVDGDDLTYTATRADGDPLPGWLAFDSGTRTFSGIPPQDFNGTLSLKVTASDGSLSASDTFDLVIDPANDAPTRDNAIADHHSDEDAAVDYTVPADAFSDVDGDALTYSATLADGDPLPEWLSFDADTRTFSGTPPQDFNGTLSLEVIASDGSVEASDTFDLVIDPVNDAPALTGFGPSATFAENIVNAAPQLLDADVAFTDPEGNFDGGTLTVSGLLAEDRIAVRDQGTAASQIGVSGSSITYGGTIIGTFVGGVGATFTVTLNAAATSAAVDALIENLTYANVSDTPTESRNLTLTVADDEGLTAGSVAATPAIFHLLAGSEDPFNGMALGTMTIPAAFDYDGDGDPDLVVGTVNGALHYLRNDGFGFTQLTGDDNPFQSVTVFDYAAPAFIDFDNDGDLDLVVGRGDGTFSSFRNDGSAFVQLSGAGNPLNGVDLGFSSTPTAVDLDDDGDLDLVAGEYSGFLFAFRNDDGTFVRLSGSASPSNVDVGFRSIPAFVDLDGDGNADAVIGSVNGTLRSFLNVGGQFSYSSELAGLNNPFAGIDVGDRSAPAFLDLDGDGDLDAVIGSNAGTLTALENVAPRAHHITVQVVPENDAPTLDNPVADHHSDEDQPVSYAIPADAFSDVDGDILTYSAALADGDPLPGWLSFDADTRTFSGTPPQDFNGPLSLKVTASDGSLEASDTFDLVIDPVNDAPALTGFGPSATFAENIVNAAPQLLDADVAFTDPEGNFDGGTLTVSGLLAEDRIAVRNEGNAAGQIGVSGSNITYSGTVIGSFAGGAGGTFTVALNAAATSEAVDALIQNLTYANVSDTPTASRDLLLNVTDAAGADLGATGPAAFAELTGAANPFNGVYVGDFSSPAFVDLDGDGDGDLVVGAGTGRLSSFGNNGDGTFTQLTGAANPFPGVDVGYHSKPSFVDLDGDGDMDAVVGEYYGTLRSFANNGDGTFTELTGAANPFNAVDVGYNSAPSFVDLDGDGDLDAVVGERYGTLRSFGNNGDGTFTELAGAANPFDGVVGRYSAPAFVDLDGDGDMDAVVGEQLGTLRAFRNEAGTFTELTGAANPFNGVSWYRSAPNFADLDGDGDMDAVVGEGFGALRSFENTAPRGQAITVDVTAENDAPVLDNAIADHNSDEDAAVNYQVPADAFSDPDGETLTYSATLADDSALPVWLSFNADTRTFSGTPPQDFNGTLALKVTASDGGESTSDTFDLVIDPINDEPVVANLIADHQLDEDQPVSYSIPADAFSDVDGDILTYSAALADDNPLPEWLNFDADTRTFSGTPPQDFNGTLSLKVTASDGTDTVSDTFELVIDPVNDAPAGTDNTITIDEDATHIFAAGDFGFSDPVEGDAFAGVALTTLPADGDLYLNGVAITVAGTFVTAADIAANLLTYEPDADGNGTGYASFTFQVRDDGGTVDGGEDTDQTPNTVTFDVTAVNDAPTVTITPTAYEPVGGELLVNTQTLNTQFQPTITSLASGGFVVSWIDLSGQGGDASSYGIKAQIFDAAGAQVGGELLVNTETLNDQQQPTITSFASGGFVVSWIDASGQGGDASSYGIKAQIFDAAGAKVGGEFLVNTEILDIQFQPTITSLASGGFVVSWTDASGQGGDSSASGIKAQIFDAAGAKVGGEFLVNTATLDTQQQPTITSLASGGFVVSWTDPSGQGGDASGYGIKAQIFDAAGAKVGGEFLVNTETLNFQQQPAITSLASGGFVVSWTDNSGQGGDASSYGIKAQIFDAAGAKVGGEFLVNTATLNDQGDPTITSLALGGFVVSWADQSGEGGDASGFGIKAQIFDAAGAKVGGEFLVNTETLGTQLQPTIASLASGGFVVSWIDNSGEGGDASSYGIKAQIFGAPGYKATEQVALDLKGTIAVADADAGAGTLTVTLTVDHGVLDVTEGTSGATIVSGNGTGSVVVSGTLAQIQALLDSDGTSTLTFTANTDAPSASAELSVTINDNGNSGDDPGLTGGAGDEQAVATATISILSVNDAPEGANKTIAIDEDGSHTFAAADFGFTDPAEGYAFAGVVITTLPANGTLTLNGSAFGAGTFVAAADIASGLLVFTPDADGNGDDYATFTFQVRDDGGTDNGGQDTDQTPNTITFDVTAINDAPTLDNPVADHHSDEDQAVSYTIPADAFSDLDGDTLTFSATLADGDPLPGWLNFDAGSRTFSGTPPLDFNGTLSIEVTAIDGTASASDTFDLVIDPVNDAPVVAIAPRTLPEGGEFRVNAETANPQMYPSVAALNGGGFVVVWQSLNQDGSGYGIYGQNYDAAGNAAGDEFQVNTTTADQQQSPSVAALVGGGFLVTWQSNNQDGSDYGIYGQRYDAAGDATGGEFQVNTTTLGDQASPFVAALGGGFVVTWMSPDDGGRDIYGQRYDDAGNAVGGEFRVNTETANAQMFPAAAELEGGGFVITWESFQDGGTWGIYGQRYDANGTAVGGEFLINTTTENPQVRSSVAGLEGGGFIVAWMSLNQDGSHHGVYGQRYDANGTAVGGEFLVNTTTAGQQWYPSVAASEGGGFIVTWQSDNQDGSAGGVYGQRYDANGTAVGGEFLINTTTADRQAHPSVATLEGGGFVVTWQSLNQDGSGWGVYGQRYGSGFDATEQTALDLKSMIDVSDVDAGAGEMTVTLSVDYGILTVTAGTSGAIVQNSGTGTVTITGTLAQIQALLDGDSTSIVAYTTHTDAPPASAELMVEVNDNGHGGDGGAQTAAAVATIRIAAVNDAPVVANPIIDRNGDEDEAVSFQIPADAFSDADGNTLVYSATLATGDPLPGWLDFDAGTRTFSGTPPQDFNGALSVEVTASDGSLSASDTFDLVIDPIDDPAAARDDDVATDENVVLNGDVFADNGNGADEDPDGPALEVSEVNGQAADVGSEIVLASGAKLTLNADGTFAYDPNGQFNYLISLAKAAATGAGNTNAIDSFTYTLVGGGTATVTVTVNGVDGAGDQLQGDSGDNNMTGTAGQDLFILDQGGDDTVIGGDSNDRFYFGDTFTPGDSVDGGGGEDSVLLRGDYNMTFGADDLVGIERLRLLSFTDDSWTYTLTTIDANVAAGQRLRVDGQDLKVGEDLFFNGQAETNGSFLLIGGAGNDTLVGGARNDEIIGGAGNDKLYGLAGDDKITGGMGADFLYGGAGRDIFIYNSVAESTGINFDTIDRLESRIDKIDLAGAFVFAGWTGNVGSGQLGTATFDADLAAAVNGAMQPNSAVLFTPDSGDFAGRTFAVVDADGDGNYQVGVDYVFEFSNPVEPPTSFSNLFF